MDHNLYYYRARVRSIYDGDTLRLDIDLGMGVWLKNQTVRLKGIDTPELYGDERENGLTARDKVRELIPPETEIIIETFKDDKGKYGRWIAEIWFNGHGRSLNEILVEENLAERKEY